MPLVRQTQERLRRAYLPRKVRILFVGESPPASQRFFYQADSGLYRAMRAAVVAALPTIVDLDDAEFLEAFCDLGCYLVDLCEQPVDRFASAKRRAQCAKGEVNLSHTLAALRPGQIITVVRSIGPNVERAVALAQSVAPHVVVSYPGRWKHHKDAFIEKVVPILRSQLGPLNRHPNV